ncbi:hypothetical protein ACFWOX_28765 [Streptomyces sp. NPDC058467]|uniref:hypothetical protein n=1 Tax=Streptomyces sp. NPDC058467 TaxID=3346513 RepID=UPI003657C541
MGRPRIPIVAAGFAGCRTARTPTRRTRHRADITIPHPADYFLHLPLLSRASPPLLSRASPPLLSRADLPLPPQGAAEVLESRRVTVTVTVTAPLSGALPRVRPMPVEADGPDPAARTVHLGRTVGLGGAKAAAHPAGIPLSGSAAEAVTRGYHLAAVPGNRIRVAADRPLDDVLPRQAAQLGLVRSWPVPRDTAFPEPARGAGAPGKPESRP